MFVCLFYCCVLLKYVIIAVVIFLSTFMFIICYIYVSYLLLYVICFLLYVINYNAMYTDKEVHTKICRTYRMDNLFVCSTGNKRDI